MVLEGRPAGAPDQLPVLRYRHVDHLLVLRRQVDIRLPIVSSRPRLFGVCHLLGPVIRRERTMIIHQSHSKSQLLPFARNSGLRCWWTNLRAYWHGRADAGQPIGPDGLTATTRALHHQADLMVSRIDEALQAALDPL